MKQHLFRGRGVPDFVPTGYSHLYLDMDTDQHWIAKGTFDVNDWVGPYATGPSVKKAIDDYAAGIDELSNKVVQYIEVVNYPTRGRFATIDPTIHAGKFLIIRDPDNRPAIGFKIEVVPSGRTRLGSQIWVYNDSSKTTSLDNYNCLVNYPLGQTDKSLEYKGVMIVRPIENNLDMFTYLVTGTMNSTIDAPTGEVNGIDAEHRANINNPHQTDKDQVGLSNVPNYPMASAPEAIAGLLGERFMSPVSVALAINAQALTPLNAHLADMANPHGVTKDTVELGFVENYPMAVDVDGVFAGDQDLEQASDRLYASPRTVAIAITRYAELNAPLLLADSGQGIMAGEQNFDDLEESTVVSPYVLAMAIEAYDDARVWATQSQAEDAAYGASDATRNKLIDPRGLGYALEKFKELNPSGDGGEFADKANAEGAWSWGSEASDSLLMSPLGVGFALKVFKTASTANDNQSKDAANLEIEARADRFMTPRGTYFAMKRWAELHPSGGEGYLAVENSGMDSNGVVMLNLEPADLDKNFVHLLPLDGVPTAIYLQINEDYNHPTGTDFVLYNQIGAPASIYFGGYNDLTWAGVSQEELNRGGLKIALNGIVRIKLTGYVGDNAQWCISGDIQVTPAPAVLPPGPVYVELVAIDTGPTTMPDFNIGNLLDIGGQFITLLPHPTLPPKAEYVFRISVFRNDSPLGFKDFTILNLTEASVKVVFSQYSEVIYQLGSPNNFELDTIRVPTYGVMKYRPIKQDQWLSTWLGTGNIVGEPTQPQ